MNQFLLVQNASRNLSVADLSLGNCSRILTMSRSNAVSVMGDAETAWAGHFF
jgi:hypothetical protein